MIYGKKYVWDPEKERLIKEKRGVGSNDVVEAILRCEVIDCIPHPNQEKYTNQRYLIVCIKGYPYVCPCVITHTEVAFKTLFASRKYKHLLLGK